MNWDDVCITTVVESTFLSFFLNLPAPKLGKVYFSQNRDKRICFDFFLHIYLNIIHAQVPRLGNYYINLNTSTCDDESKSKSALASIGKKCWYCPAVATGQIYSSRAEDSRGDWIFGTSIETVPGYFPSLPAKEPS